MHKHVKNAIHNFAKDTLHDGHSFFTGSHADIDSLHAERHHSGNIIQS
jgi:hypothetical protein